MKPWWVSWRLDELCGCVVLFFIILPVGSFLAGLPALALLFLFGVIEVRR